MNQSFISHSITFMNAVYTKIIATGLIASVSATVFVGVFAIAPVASVEAACAATPAYVTLGPSNGTAYFASGATFAEGTYRISYEEGIFSWDSGSHFIFYTPNYGGRGFRALYTNGSVQSVPILRMANGSFATTYYTSEADVAGAYDDVYYQFNSTGGKIGISFNDDDSDNRGPGVKFKLTRVSGGDCNDDSNNDDDDDYDYDYEGPLGGSCYANRSSVDIDEEVTFRAEAYGGDGDYTYSWDGSEDLDGNKRTVEHEYDRPGYKTAEVTIRSDGRSITRSCSVYVYDNDDDDYYYNDNYNNSNLNVSCTATTGYVGDTILWTINSISGGNGYYTYSWDGTNNLSGSNGYVYKSYSTPGTKTATITVRSNGRSVSRTCSTMVYERYTYNQPNYPTYVPPTYTQYPTGGGVTLTLDQTGPTQVRLNNVPYTGLSDNIKIILFVTGLVGWSAIVAYIFIVRPRMQS